METNRAQKLGEKIKLFLKWMDRYVWFRMAVCIMPPIVIAQLVWKLDLGQTASMVCLGLLAAGTYVYSRWHALRAKLQADYDEKHPQAEVEDELALAEMSELIEECGGDAERAEQAVIAEMRFNPDLTMREGIAVAKRRNQAYQRQQQAAAPAAGASD